MSTRHESNHSRPSHPIHPRRPAEPVLSDADRALAAGESFLDDDGRPRFCIDGRRHPCPIHWPDEHAALVQACQAELDLDYG